MFKITRVNDSRLDIEMSGRLNSEQMEKALDELVEKSEGIERGRMLYDVVDYHLPSLGAIAIEKHITLSHEMDGPDHKASLEPNDFKQMVQQIRWHERNI